MASSPTPGSGDQLIALAVDDELPALSEMTYLLDQDPRIAKVLTAQSGTDALRVLDSEPVDVVFSDINMPGLDGMSLARVIARFAERPSIVFVTAHDAHAVDAFAVQAADYVMKPVRAQRLAEAIRRVVEARSAVSASAHAGAGQAGVGQAGAAQAGGPQGAAGGGSRAERIPAAFGAEATAPGSAAPGAADETVPVELGGVTRFINRSEIRFVQAHGDYARLHTASGSHLIRVPLVTLEERWGASGFVRIHRSTLVSTQHITEVRMEHGRCTVVVDDGRELQVSRRHTRALKDRMMTGPSGWRAEA